MHISIIKFENSNFHDHIQIPLVKTNPMIYLYYVKYMCLLLETMSSAWETTRTDIISPEAARGTCEPKESCEYVIC